MFPPPPRKSGVLRTLLTIVLVIALGGSLLLNLALLVGGALGSDGSTIHTTLNSGDSSQKIVVVPIEGIITGGTADLVGRWLKEIENDSAVKAVVLEVNTPGGEVTASDEIYNQIVQLKSRRGIPIIVTMGGFATSGGYYVSAPADYIFAQPTTLTGNIGVRMDRFNVSELAKKWGVAESTLTAPQDGFKNAGSMFQPENAKETEYLQGLVNSMYAQFKGIVSKGRSGKLKGNIDDICNGQVYLGPEAEKNGLIDKIGYREDALAEARKLINAKNPTIVKLQRRPLGVLDMLVGARMESGRGGINVNIDAGLLREAETPRFMYLWKPDWSSK